MESERNTPLKYYGPLLCAVAACLLFFTLAMKFDLFATGYSLLPQPRPSAHGYLDEYLTALLLPVLVVTFYFLHQLIGLKREAASRRQAEEALRESEERFRLVFDQSEEAVVLALYASGEIIYANATMEKLLGYGRDELFAGGLPLLYERFEKEVMAGLSNRQSVSQDFLSTRVNTIGKNGAGLVISLRRRMVKIGGNDLVFLSLRNMTEKVRLEEEARIAHAKLIHSNKMISLGMLVSGMAHEINNPNNFIMFNSGMLADIWTDADRVLNGYFLQNGGFSLGGLPYPEVGQAARRLIEGIGEGAQRIKIIVDDLRDFARQDNAEAGRKMDVNAAILKAAAILTPQIKRHTARFSLQLQENIPENVGNIHKIEQVVINLLLNALQALPDKECGVTVSTGLKDGETIVVVVRDEGCGMTGEALARISEPFFTTKSASSGTGLGIFISQSIVDAHRGTLRFDSTPGGGTTATIELPIGGDERR